MERALDPELLNLALGDSDALPSPEDLARLLSEVEIDLLFREAEISDELLKVGWYLHAVASSDYALEVYGLPRQRAAFRVSGHVFDLLLQKSGMERTEKLKYCFATQVAYIRGELDPNALALRYREFGSDWEEMSILTQTEEVSLSCGVALLGFDTEAVYAIAGDIQNQVQSLIDRWGIDSILNTPFGAVFEVVSGTLQLMDFLLYGDPSLLTRARSRFLQAVRNLPSASDQMSRWVAAHLLSLTGDLENASIWTSLPPNVPESVKRSFTLGDPKILTLWPPQLKLLKPENPARNPLTFQVKRLFISTPTSGGKTLLAQLLIMTHLALKRTSVCYVAPTRSLCAEISEALKARLRFIRANIAAGFPEGNWVDDFLSLELEMPEIEVMTPERLSNLIRSNNSDVLSRFGMFVFDEVHMISDSKRGWTLEGALSYLHHATRNTDHRIVLISAAIGNKFHFIQWMGEENVLSIVSEWRGPRRIDGIWATDIKRDARLLSEHPRAWKFPYRAHYPQYGKFYVRVSHTDDIKVVKTNQPIGRLIRRIDKNGIEERARDSKSTPMYKMLVYLIRHLSKFGPVLVVESTRPRAIKMAEAIAEETDPVDNRELQSLIDLTELRLGRDHPLQQVLEKGVAYHYGSLPSEVRIAIQGAVASGSLKYLVSTTTMTEGINLPVKSVVIASQGYYREDGFHEYITGPKLINAIGRAGRATKETEGIVVLALNTQPSAKDFERFTPSESDLHITSRLAAEESLNELANFEDSRRTAQDAVFEVLDGIVSDFMTFVWFIAAALERMGKATTLQDIQALLESTLAWKQLDPRNRERWLEAASLALSRYDDTDPISRRRWATAGTALGTAEALEGIAREIATHLLDNPAPQNAVDVVDLIIGDGRLQTYLNLPECPDTKIYTRRGRGRAEIDLSIDVLLREWIQGAGLVSLANEYLTNISDINYRFEKLCDFIYEYFEVFLPWIFGKVISWTNEFLEEMEVGETLPETIPGYVRYGVDNPVALRLLLRGIKSRNLALRMADEWESESRDDSIRAWIRSMDLVQWRSRFEASATELKDLLEFSRDQQEGLDVNLIMQGRTIVEVESKVREFPKSVADLLRVEESVLSPIHVEAEGEVVAKVRSCNQSGLKSVLATGVPLLAQFWATAGRGFLELKLIQPD